MIEYAVLFVIVIGAFIIMRNYIQRGVFGLWVQPGQSLAYGRQYDPQKSIECDFDPRSNLWYDHNCLSSQITLQCNADCQESIIQSGSCQGSCSEVTK